MKRTQATKRSGCTAFAKVETTLLNVSFMRINNYYCWQRGRQRAKSFFYVNNHSVNSCNQNVYTLEFDRKTQAIHRTEQNQEKCTLYKVHSRLPIFLSPPSACYSAVPYSLHIFFCIILLSVWRVLRLQFYVFVLVLFKLTYRQVLIMHDTIQLSNKEIKWNKTEWWEWMKKEKKTNDKE